MEDRVRVYTGANGSFEEIRDRINEPDFDGHEAVDFIIEKAAEHTADDKLTVIPIGKLTNIALALLKEPSLSETMRVFWLGSNWPNAGEYNLENDPGSVRAVVESDVELDIATVRYDGQPEPGTASVIVNLREIKERMTGVGPLAAQSVTGRAGGEFVRFGDYSVDLMSRIVGGNENGTRALYDQAAVAILKNPEWATVQELPAPALNGIGWEARPNNPRKIRFWHSFERDAIVGDFFASMNDPNLQ
jgi:hypothetical protein